MRNLIIALLMIASPAWAGDPILPNPALTPGETLQVGLDKVCSVGYTKTVRNVSEAKKDHVYELYGITRIPHLWPQSYFTETWNARVKDGLEHYLNRLVCDGKLSLEDAQKAIATDWIAAYCKYYNKLPASCARYMEKK